MLLKIVKADTRRALLSRGFPAANSRYSLRLCTGAPRLPVLLILPILLNPQLPSRAQRAGQNIFVRLRQTNMSGAHPTPPTMNGKKNVGHLLDKCGLLLRVEHQIAVALLARCERSKNASTHAEVSCAHMRALFSSLHAECNASEIIKCHRSFLVEKVSYTARYYEGDDPRQLTSITACAYQTDGSAT
jgi:hypothetical protein